MSLLTGTIPLPQGEAVSLIKDSNDEFYIFTPPEDWPNAENTILFIAKDKKAYDKLAARLQQVIVQIRMHNAKCECS